MENFDAVGRWRERDGQQPIDATGVFPEGTKFEGIPGLKKELLRQPEQFVGTVAERLLMYAIGRNLQYYDAPTVRAVMREAEPANYTLGSLVLDREEPSVPDARGGRRVMFVSKKSLPRRTFLRAMGTTIALPFLDAMVPALSARALKPTPRFGFVYIANGVIQNQWTPATTGFGFELARRCRRSPAFATRSRSSAASRTCRPIRSATAPAIIRARRLCG